MKMKTSKLLFLSMVSLVFLSIVASATVIYGVRIFESERVANSEAVLTDDGDFAQFMYEKKGISCPQGFAKIGQDCQMIGGNNNERIGSWLIVDFTEDQISMGKIKGVEIKQSDSFTLQCENCRNSTGIKVFVTDNVNDPNYVRWTYLGRCKMMNEERDYVCDIDHLDKLNVEAVLVGRIPRNSEFMDPKVYYVGLVKN